VSERRTILFLISNGYIGLSEEGILVWERCRTISAFACRECRCWKLCRSWRCL